MLLYYSAVFVLPTQCDSDFLDLAVTWVCCRF